MAKRLYVGNLPWSFSSSDLEALFSPFGAVSSAEVISDRETGRSRGFGFVEMESADEAIRALHESEVQGRNITVNEARERSPKPRGGGGGGGYGGGGGGYGGGRRGNY